jgi:hypothetical protein
MDAQEQDNIRETFHAKRQKVLRARRGVGLGVLGIFAVAALAGLLFQDTREVWIKPAVIVATCLVAALLVGGSLFEAVHWCCPECGASLGRSLSLKHCPDCGAQLQ